MKHHVKTASNGGNIYVALQGNTIGCPFICDLMTSSSRVHDAWTSGRVDPRDTAARLSDLCFAHEVKVCVRDICPGPLHPQTWHPWGPGAGR